MSYKIFFQTRLKINDHFENVFIKTFFKVFLKKKKKISKTIYLFYLLICFLNKNESITLPRFLFIIILNILLYSTLTFKYKL